MLADDADATASGGKGFFSATPQGDKEFLAREKVRLEIVREIFDGEMDAEEAAGPGFARKLAKLLRLS